MDTIGDADAIGSLQTITGDAGALARGQFATNRMTILCMGDVKRKADVRNTLSAEATRKPVA